MRDRDAREKEGGGRGERMRLIMSEKRGRNKLTLEGCRLVSEVRQTQRQRESERERVWEKGDSHR